MIFYPFGGIVNIVSQIDSASLAVSSSFLSNWGLPIPTASITLSGAPGPIGPSGSNTVSASGSQGATGTQGVVGPRGLGTYTGSLTLATCCVTNSYECEGYAQYYYDSSCIKTLICDQSPACGGTGFCS